MKKSNTSFKQSVLKAVFSIPYGKVVSYGQVALMVGVPRGARQVGWVLHSTDGSDSLEVSGLPWWRVINNAGRISIKGTAVNTPLLQKHLLEKEDIYVADDLTIDIERYRYRPGPSELAKLELPEEYLQSVLAKFL